MKNMPHHDEAPMTSLHTASPVTRGAKSFPQMHTALLFIAAKARLTTMLMPQQQDDASEALQ